ncbi:MAG: hypothetical protein EBR09_09740 [Proteobacteria bacterium]|nr:hypothetical protein [Pseudomonadota bacterium]
MKGNIKSCFFFTVLSSSLFIISCGLKNSAVNSRTVMTQPQTTLIDAVEGNILVRLNAQDSDRLSKSFSKVVIQPTDKPPAPDAVNSYSSSTEDLKIDCAAGNAAGVSKSCTVSLKSKPSSPENTLQSDESSGEHMFHLRKLIDVKRLYSSLTVKEWDLQGSTYKRFSTSDNKMILECILDDERSRCSIFLSNGQSDDFSD